MPVPLFILCALLLLTRPLAAQHPVSQNPPASPAPESQRHEVPSILLFWSPTCKTSVDALADLEALQQQFGNRLQAIAITKDSGSRVTGAQAAAGSGLQFRSADTALSRQFPYSLVPHIVWMAPGGSVAAVTSGEYLSAAYIDTFLSGRPLHWYEKEDNLTFSDSRPLLVGGNGGADSQFLYRSLLTGYRPGLPAQMGWYQDSAGLRVAAYNMSIADLYTLAIPEAYSLPPARWLFDGVAAERFRYGSGNREAWNRAHLYCYERSLPYRGNDTEPAVVKGDLDAWFGLRSRIEKRPLACWVISGKPLPVSSGTERKKNLREPGPKFLQNESLNALIYFLQKQPGMLPIVNETGHSGGVSLRLPDDLTDMEQLKRALSKAGLRLTRDVRRIDAVVLSPASGTGKITSAHHN